MRITAAAMTALAALLAGGKARADVELVRDGEPGAALVLGRQPTRSAQLAAGELQEHFRLMSGTALPILHEGDALPAGAVPVYVGEGEAVRAMGLTATQFAPHESLVRVADGYVAVVGCDDLDFGAVSYEKDGAWPGFQARLPFHRLGTLYAAYNLLERQCGVRWYLPTDLGRVTPERKTIALRAGDIRERPWTRYRLTSKSAWQMPGEYPVEGRPNTLISRRDENLHVLRSRMGGEPYGVNHSVYNYHERFGKEHPDWFVGNSPGQHIQLKYNSTGVVAQVAQDAIDHLRKPFSERRGGAGQAHLGAGDFFACVPKDNRDYGDECEPPLQPERQQPGRFGNGTASDYILTWVNRVAERVNVECPDGWISAAAYAATFEPPSFDLQPNVAVTVCMADGWTGYGLDVLKQWRRKVSRIFLWEYYIDGSNFPRHQPHAIAAYLRELQAMAAEGMFIEMDSQPGGAENRNPALYHLNHYVTFRMLRERDVDVDALLDEYYRLFYGPAEAPMRTFWGEIERLREALDTQNLATGLGGGIAKPYERWTTLASADELDKLAGALTDAERLAATDTVIQKRVAMARSGVLEYLREKGDQARAILGTERPVLVAAKAGAAVTVDGELDEEVWSKASPSSAFVTLQNKPVDVNTVCLATRDDTHLYIGVRCDEPDMASLRMDQKVSSSGICTDESVELFLDVGNRGQDYVQVMVSAGGLIWYQWKGKYPPNKTPDLGLRAQAHRGEAGWTVEVALPFAALGLAGPGEGDTWGLNVMRNRFFKGMKWMDERSWLAWSPTFMRSYHIAERFGLLRFE